MGQTYKQTIEDLESAVKEIESQGISIAPLNKAIENLKTHSSNIEIIEKNIDSVKAEVITPIKEELIENKRAGRFSIWGFYIGAFGLVVTAISLIYTTFSKSSMTNYPTITFPNNKQAKGYSDLTQSINELTYFLHGLNDTFKPVQNEFLINHHESAAILKNDSNNIYLQLRFIEEGNVRNKCYPFAYLAIFINDKQLGFKGLLDNVKIINNSMVASYNSIWNSIILSENDEFVILNKYRFKIMRILRVSSQILSICDNKDAVIIKRIN
jgi:hypothetical protein